MPSYSCKTPPAPWPPTARALGCAPWQPHLWENGPGERLVQALEAGLCLSGQGVQGLVDEMGTKALGGHISLVLQVCLVGTGMAGGGPGQVPPEDSSLPTSNTINTVLTTLHLFPAIPSSLC